MNIFNKKYPDVYTISAKNPGKTILITAGIDGDEYAGIDAAFRLLSLYRNKLSHGKLIIIPVINQKGMEGRASWNPDDNKYPKHTFPGKKNGSATEQLMFWFYNCFIAGKKVDVWIDLHSGASNETLLPYIHTHETGIKEVDDVTTMIIKKLSYPVTIYEKKSSAVFPIVAATHTIPYIMLESGELGKRDDMYVEQHIKWVNVIINSVHSPTISKKNIHIYTTVSEYLAEDEGLWHPVPVKKFIKKNALIGTLKKIGQQSAEKISAYSAGTYLWGKHDVYCRKGDSLIGIASHRKLL